MRYVLKKLPLVFLTVCVMGGASPIAFGEDEAYEQRSQQAGDIIDQARPLSRAGRLKEANDLYERAIKLDPNQNSAMVHNNLGTVLLGMGQMDGAIEQFKKALQFDPSMLLAKNNLASCELNQLSEEANKLKQAGQYDQAISLYEQAVKIDPSRAMSHNNLATGFQAKGELDRAITEYQQALSLQPDMELATINIARSYFNSGMFEQAKEYFEKYLKQYPNSGDVGEARTSLESIRHHQGVGKSDPDSPDYFKSATERDVLRWPAGAPIRVFIASGDGVKDYRPAFRHELIDSLNQWTAATHGKLTWTLISSPDDANIICNWTNSNTGFKTVGDNPEVQGEVSSYQTFRVAGAKYIRNTSMNISTANVQTGQPLTDGQALDICLHEVGHALGLVGHSTNYHDVMFFISNPGGGSVTRSLTARDIATINRLYDGYPTQSPH